MRTRRTAVAACFLLVVSLLGACGGDEASEPDASTPSATSSLSASASSSGTASPSPTAAPPGDDATKLTIRGLSVGGWPTIAYAAADDPADPSGAWALIQSGGATRLPVTGIHSVATIGNGAVVLADDGDGTAAVVVDGSGQEIRREESGGYRLAVSVHGNIAAWLAPDRSVRVEEGGEGTIDLPAVPGAVEMGALIGYDTCLEAESDVGGCTAFVDVDEPRQAWLTSSHGIVDIAGSMLSVVDATVGSRVLGLISVTDEGSCSGLFKKLTKAAWQTCDHTLTSFSPSGRRVLGTDAYLDGFGQRSIAFLDAADGTVLHEFLSTGRGATVLQTAWEDEEHVLAVLYERGRWAIARLGVDGSAELAVGPVEGSDLDRPFVLEQD